MTVAKYAKKYNVSKQSIYDKLKRGTLQSKVINGVKHIISIPKVVSIENHNETLGDNKFKKLLKKLNKSRLKIEKLELKIEFLDEIVKSKNNEITTLEKSLNAFTMVLDKKLLTPSIVYEAELEEKKPKKKNKR